MAEMDHNDHNRISNFALYQRLGQDDIKRLREIFKSHEEQKFTIIELENILEQFRIYLSQDQIKSLFLKINTSRDEHCDWDEFVSHLLYEFQCDDPNNQKGSLTLPIVDKPIIHESCHRFLIIRIRLNPVLLPVLNGVQFPDQLQEQIANRRLKKKKEEEEKQDDPKVSNEMFTFMANLLQHL